MEVRYILGRAGSGKTHKIFSEIKENLIKNPGKKLYLIVPEQFTLQTESDLIYKMELDGIMDVEILSFQRLAYKVLTEVGGIKKNSISDLGKVMVLKRLFDTHKNDLTMYKNASRQPGFLVDFSNLLREFKKSDISPELLSEKLDGYNDNMFTRKIKDVTFIFEKFNEYMKDKYTDDEDRYNLLIERIEDAKFLDNSEVWIDGYSGFTKQQLKILEKLFSKSQRVNISLTIDLNNRDKDMFSPTLYTYEKLISICNDSSIPYKVDKVTDYSNKTNELKHLEREFFSYPFRKYEEDVNNIKMFSASNPYGEVENIAQEIVTLVRESNYRWKDIAVVSPSMESYPSIIKKVLREYDIPFFIDEKRNIMNNPIVKFVLSSLDIINKHFKYEDVFRFVKTGFSGLSKNESDILENYVLAYGIKGEKWFDDFIYEDENLEALNDIRVRLINPFKNFLNRVKKKATVLELTKALYDLIKEFEIEEKLDTWINELTNKGNFEYVNENTQIWNILMEVFDQLVEILGDTRITLKEYINLIQAGFSEYKVGIIPPTIDQVLVGNLDRSKSHDIKALFLLGVNDGVLPSGFEDSGIILDDEKQAMKELGIPMETDIQTRALEERFSIYTMFAKPSKVLFISYSLADREGKALRPSIFIDRFKSLFPSIKPQSDLTNDKDKQLKHISKPISTFKYLINHLRDHIDGNEIDDMWWEVYSWYYNNDTWKEKLDNMLLGLFYDNQVYYIGNNMAKKLYNMPLKASISRVEKFINCPFSHFINYGLKPKDRREYKVEKFDIGTLFHNSVEAFSRKLTLENLDWRLLDKENSDKIVEKVVDEIIEDYGYNVLSSSHRYRYLAKKLKRVTKRAVWTLTEHIKRGDFNPIEHEFGFGEGKDNKVPPIVLQLPGGEEIKLEGRIDRIDILKDSSGEYVKVIDYKSGNKEFSLSEVYYGLQIQLIVYLDAILENKDRITKNSLYPGGVLYFKIDDPMINSEDNNEELIEEEIMKKLKMKGLILKDINVIKAMDKSISDGGRSQIIPAYITKKGDISKTSHVLEGEEIGYLIKHVRNIIIEMADEILKGNISINPCKIDNKSSCDYCKYASICQFDTTIENNQYKNIQKLSNDDVIKRIKEEVK